MNIFRQTRFNADGVYTFVADILVAINPYRWIDMYGKQYKERYNPANHMCPEPHVYAIAQAAAKNLRLLNRDQVCIVSGESGSGKTETAKLFMHHLLTYSEGPSPNVLLVPVLCRPAFLMRGPNFDTRLVYTIYMPVQPCAYQSIPAVHTE